MSSDSPPALRVACPHCSRGLRVPAQMLGRRGRCRACGREFLIPAADAPGPPTLPATPPPAPRHVSFACELCETRMTVSVSQVGKLAKCPDCGHLTKVPPPPAPRKPVIPAAMSGEQYEVWGVDENPTPEQIAAVAPPLIAVECRLCGTLMYARHDQIGESLACPDCGAKTPVSAPRHRPPAGLRPPADGDDYQLDETSAPTPRPVPRIAAITEAERHEKARARHEDPRLSRRQASRGDETPTMPRVPLVQGMTSMLLTGAIATWWLGLSTVLIAVAWLGLQVQSAFAGGMGAIMAICFLAVAVMLGGCWYTAASAISLATLTESSDGHRRLIEPPGGNFLEWFGDAAYIFVAAGAATLPAWVVGRFVPLGPLEPFAVGVAVALAAFPLMLLSSLEEGSAMGVFHPGVWSTLLKRPAAWLLFWGEAAALWIGAGWLMLQTPAPLLLAPPIAVAALLVYFRLIGLLGWWLAESLATEQQERPYDPRDYRSRAE